MSQVGEAFVVVRPLVQDFRRQVADSVNRNLPATGIPVPVTPEIPRGSKPTWKKLANGASIPEVLPLPVAPTISPAAKEAFAAEAKGLRGLLLGTGQFAASRSLGISGAAAGLFAFGLAAVGAVKSAANLEQELNVFQQVSGASAKQMAAVRAEARRLGADLTIPAVSAGDAAATMTSLAKAGLSVNQVLAGTKGTLQLAAAAQIDFATASELSANALNAFQLSGSDAVKVADLLAGAANAAQGDISDFGQALTQSAAVAHQAGLSVQETVTFLTELAKAGIQGSDAGTSLRVALLRLIAPTKEARDIFNALGIEITDSAGNVRVDVFEQLRRSMLGLSPATRNAALATIFGTDAIRSAAIFTREGAAGFERLERQVGRQGQAAETAEARTKGLSGALAGLSSNIETFGSDIGTIAIPAFTLLADEASTLVTELDKADTKLIDIVTTLGNIKIPGSGGKTVFHTLGEGFKAAGTIAADSVPGIAALRREVILFQKVSALFADKPIFAPPKVSPKGTDAFGLRAFLKTSLADPALEKAMEDAGRKAGGAFTHGTASEITKKEQEVIDAAKKTVRDAQASLRDVVAEGQKAVAETVRQGADAVAAAALDAKQNLTSIGQSLVTQVQDILASGPLAQRISDLQDRLDRSRAGIERTNLRRTLRDAKEELARAEAETVGPTSAAERAGAEQFLRPFREKVKDAQAALQEFDTQATIDTLTARLQRQTEQIGRQINGVVAKFNAGLISGGQANERLVAILQKNVGPIAKAGTAQGFAFRQAFAAELAALQAQIRAIVGGPGTRKTGAEPTIVSPANVAAQAAADVKAAQQTATKQTVAATRSVKEAIEHLQKVQRDAITAPNGTNDILRDIRRELKASASKSSSDVVGDRKKPKVGKR